ncbi:ornithine carbamoyltransferase [Propionicicella superfundia]|uniref:ornithine carbamoyltransferase n=1 Tax=Propionicicella superfundia TaxID=348582 RepID=UPI0004179CA1|nr:ornithine carbamoyltransferase [Propionicicella superfundia]
MAGSLKGRHFLKEQDFTPAEWRDLLALTGELKSARAAGREQQMLGGLNLALIFEKTSTRTRSAFEVAAHQQGAHVTQMDGNSSQLGHKESPADTARVLSRLFDGIEYRGTHQSTVEKIAHYSSVPVWNGLTDEWHPTQSLCDMFTMRESSGLDDHDIAFAYVGDARFNVGCSLLIGGALLGMDVRIVAPGKLLPPDSVVRTAREIAAATGARITLTDDLDAVKGCRFIHTDIWVSMGESESVWTERILLLQGYQVNTALLERTGVPEVKFMHCLPAYHNRETTVGEAIYQRFGLEELEVTEEVFESPASIVFDQAENRMHSIKALLIATLT